MAGRGRPSRASIHQRLANEVAELRRYGGIPSPVEAEGIWKEIWYSEAHSSTAIEGNTLVLKEVETLLRDGRAVGDKQLKDYLEVQGYAKAASWVYGQAVEPDSWQSGCVITLQEVRHVHSLAMEPVWKVAPHPMASDTEGPGNWRQHNIQPFPGGMIPPDHTLVQSHMTEWADQVCTIPTDSSPISEAIAKYHAAFEQIHPFLDGNGRTGRLVTNLIFVRLGYPPAIIHRRDRERYLEALRRSDHGDPGPLGEILARAVINNLMRFVLPGVAGPAKLVPLEALATSDLSISRLRAAIERGRLRAVKTEDGRWLSSRHLVDEYLSSRYARMA